MNLAKAFGVSSAIRTRSFELNRHQFKVRVPLTAELEAMHERLKVVDKEISDKYYADLTKVVNDNKEEYAKIDNVQITDDDVLIDGKSMREIADQKALAERRIVELFRLLVPEEKDFDMATIDYPMIDELFPFAIQLEIIENISKTISPEYKETRGK